ncbi:hypothetical protein [Actinotalea caeni]|uniref:hypothetical protein n=1 Tax=Actinotalea caeni TaxID=1348467 RepID=UPI0012E1FEFE|nr:hypothetical protein [Actinotalea caeni]
MGQFHARRAEGRPNRFRSAAIAFLVAFGLTVSAGAAIAGTASGNKGYYSVGGYSYANQSIITTGSTDTARVEVWKNPRTGLVPAGYVGALARGYRDVTGTDPLVCSAGYYYNANATQGYAVNCYFTGSSGSAYYSYGVTKGWTGSVYNAYFAPRSPNQTA